MITLATVLKTFQKRANNWERDEGDWGKVVASELRCLILEVKKATKKTKAR